MLCCLVPLLAACGALADPAGAPAQVQDGGAIADAGPNADAAPRRDAAPIDVPPDPFSGLTGLTTSSGPVSPSFDPSVPDYTVVLRASRLGLPFTVTPAVAPGFSVTINGVPVGSGTASAPIPLALLSATPIDIAVTRPSGVVSRYSLAAPPQETAHLQPNPAGGATRAVALSADGRTLAVSASGHVYVFTRTAAGWFPQKSIALPSRAVALSGDGNTLAVGNEEDDSAATGIDGDPNDTSMHSSGAAVVFSRAGTTWSQTAYVKASNTRPGALFGASVALSSNGKTLAVGSPFEKSAASGIDGDPDAPFTNGSGTRNPGAVYVFAQDGAGWAQQAYVKPSNTTRHMSFGGSVALASDGNTLAAGAELEPSAATGVNGAQSDASAPEAGAAYVFSRTGSTWAQEAYVKASNTRPSAHLSLVALAGDGNTLAVGAWGETSNATGIDGDQSNAACSLGGAVYVYARKAGAWTQQAYVKASNTHPELRFGKPTLSANGNLLAIGAYGENSSSTGINGSQLGATDDRQIGAAYLFARRGAVPVWSQQAYVKASSPHTFQQYGSALAISADGSTLAVGSGGGPVEGGGGVSIYR